MEKTITLKIDGREYRVPPGLTVLEAAELVGIFIPRLCYLKGLEKHGSCRACTVKVNGRPQASCTLPAEDGMEIEVDTPELKRIRADIIQMLFVEGNHVCPSCERSGNCELQALAYRMGITAPKYPFMFPERPVEAEWPVVFIDQSRCILCGRCVSASRDIDGKNIFHFVGRGKNRRVVVDEEMVKKHGIEPEDEAVKVCPVGAILLRGKGFAVPIGNREYDKRPIGSEVENTVTASD